MKVYVLAKEVVSPTGKKSSFASGKKVLIESTNVFAFPETVDGGDGARLFFNVANKPWEVLVTASLDDIDAGVTATDLYQFT